MTLEMFHAGERVKMDVFSAYGGMELNAKKIAYWGLTGALMAAGICLSIVERNGHYAFEWQGSELMAQTRNDGYHDMAALQVFNRVLLQLQQNYVDPTRLDPELMIASALDNLQKNVPELLLTFDRKVKERPTKVTVNISGQSREFALNNLENLWEMSLRLRGIFSFIQEYLPKDVKQRELEYDAINGMLSALDPHSLILSPEVYRSMAEGNRGKFGGLGIVVRMIDGVLIVVEPITGDVPAKRAGIEEGDQILTIDGTPTLNMSISEAVDLLKGEPKTTVHLTVMRKGWKSPKPIDVIRDEISIPSVESDVLGDKIAYVKLKSFQGNSQSDMQKALEKLRAEMGGMDGLVLDLRGNPGGLLEQAVQIADNFLESGTIVTTVGGHDLLQKPRYATKEKTESSYPIVVLMDSSSASASEIVAGALKNNNRALIVGDTSFGKGSVQVLYELPDKSALKLTIGQYLTPGDLSIQSVGIVPDIRLVPMRATDGTLDLYPRPWQRREESLGGHLDNQNALRDIKPAYSLRYLTTRYALPEEDMDDDTVITIDDIDKLIKNKQKTNKPVDDPQVRLAREILKNVGGEHERAGMIEAFMKGADVLQKAEDEALVSSLGKQGIDWQACASPSEAKLKVKLETGTAGNDVTAGDELTLRATVVNEGQVPVCRVAGRTESSFLRVNDREFIFGRVEPGASVTRELKFKTNRALNSRVDDLKLNVFLDDGTPVPASVAATASAELHIHAIEQPAFKIHYAILDRDGKAQGNSLLDDDEDVTMRIWVSNDGKGTAQKPLVYLKNKAPEIKLVDARAETEPLEKGALVSRDFKFRTSKVGAEDIQMELHVYDKSSTQVLLERISFKTSKGEAVAGQSLTHVSRVMRVRDGAKLYVSPVGTANSLFSLDGGTVVRADAEFGAYTHVTAGQTVGWVETAGLEAASDAAVSQIEPKTIATIPRIILPEMSHVTDQDTITIEADVTSFAPLTDYYIYTAADIDHTYTYEKVAYSQLSSESGHIRATVPLSPGLNSVRLYVRDQNKSEAYENILVFRR